MLNFNTTLKDVISTQTTGRSTVKQFTEYTSKKKLLESGILDEKVATYIKELKNAFDFHVHKDLRYMVISVYCSTNKSYKFFVLDMQTLQVAEVQSIKIAKKEIMQLVTANK